MVTRLTAWFFGIRHDLKLNERWWHRLMFVVFILASIGIALFVGALSYHEPPLDRTNIVVLAHLGDYTESHPELANAVPSFVSLGHVAFESPEGSLENYYLLEYEYFCSAELKGHPKEVAAFLRRADTAYADMDTAKAVKWLNDHDTSGEKGNCIARKNSDLPASSKIIAYRFTTRAVVLRIAHAALWAAGALLVWSLIALNGYYRGLVYVIFGPERKQVGK